MNKTLRTFERMTERKSGTTMGRSLAVAALVAGALALGGCAHRPNNAQLGTGVGAVAGGVLGAVVGNQIGKGNGRTAATVLGAVGGGYAGHEIEKRTRTQTTYQVRVRLEDGSSRVFTRSQPPAVGTPVVLQGKGFRVADEGTLPQAQQPQPAPQYQTVSQPGYVAMQQ